MKWANFTERQQLLVKFGVVYTVTIALIAGGYLLSTGHENQPVVEQTQPASEQVRAATVSAIDRANDLLGRHVERLRQLDIRYISRLIDSFSHPALEELNSTIQLEEQSLGKTIDSLELQGSPYISLATAFRSVLKDHLSLSNIRMTLPEEGKISGDKKQDLLQILKELQEKDNRIAVLEGRLREASGDDRKSDAGAGGAKGGNSGVLPGLQADNDVLRQQLSEEQKTIAVLRQQLGGLQHANELLNTRLTEANGMAGTHENEGNTLLVRNTALEKKTVELADELRFAQVDCNLSRVDGRQLIYTARQRKDLLTDALATLNDLVRSPNTEVQRKAKEKLGQLRNLAAGGHD